MHDDNRGRPAHSAVVAEAVGPLLEFAMVQAAPKIDSHLLKDAETARDVSRGGFRDLRAMAAAAAAATASGSVINRAPQATPAPLATPVSAPPSGPVSAPRIEIFREYDAVPAPEAAAPAAVVQDEIVIFDDTSDIAVLADSPFVAPQPTAPAPVAQPLPQPMPMPMPEAVYQPQPIAAPTPAPMAAPVPTPVAAPEPAPMPVAPPAPTPMSRPKPRVSADAEAPQMPMRHPKVKPAVPVPPPLPTQRPAPISTLSHRPAPELPAEMQAERRSGDRRQDGAWVRDQQGLVSHSVTHVNMPGVAFRTDKPLEPGTLRPFQWSERGRSFAATICVIACKVRRDGKYDVKANLV